jgi:hypothetical protein
MCDPDLGSMPIQHPDQEGRENNWADVHVHFETTRSTGATKLLATVG